MLQTSSPLILWLAACVLLPGQLEGWAAPSHQNAQGVARALPVQAPLLPAAVQMTALGISELGRRSVVTIGFDKLPLELQCAQKATSESKSPEPCKEANTTTAQ
ncbi:hypothetical protein IWX87_002372 [Polaromonas sp. CG_9.7]|nr:hypothetical protein [Polaromonas sp. CG_9.7]MBG6114672.1 hypothetical protein [Polaromonas sp. CG_9.2]MDH6185163.1 hypothetical protein [Polaromonas sp. CG_23.6]